MEFKNINLDNQLDEIESEIKFYNKAKQNYENLQKALEGNEHLRHIYEPAAKLLLENAEHDCILTLKQAANSYRKVDTVSDVAYQINASTMDITLKTPERFFSGFIDMGLLGKTLSNFQSMIYSIMDPSKGRKKKAIRNAGALAVSAFAPGSFVVRVHEQTNGLIADENQIFENTIPVIGELIDSSEDITKLKDIASKLELTTLSIFRRLLKTLSNGESGINFEWVTPSGKKQEYSLSFQQVKNMISLFDSDKSLTNRRIQVEGTLTMFEMDNVNKRRLFKIIGFDDITYSGIVDENLPGYFIPNEITAIIEERVIANNTTDEEATSYILLSINQYKPNKEK